MKEIATAIFPALIAALLYFTGFIYLSAYYGYFGIVTSELDINAQDVFVNSYVALNVWLQHFWWPTAGAALFSLLFIAAIWPLTPAALRKFLLDQKISVGAAVFLALFIAAYPIASYSGAMRADAAIYSLPPLQLAMSEDNKDVHICLSASDCTEQDDLQFVAASASTIFAISRRGSQKEFWTYRIPVDRLAFSRAFKYIVKKASGGVQ